MRISKACLSSLGPIRARFLIYTATALLLLATFLILSKDAQAQTSAGIKIEPPIVEEKSDPGATFNSSLRLTNVSQETHTYYVDKRDIASLASNGAPIFALPGEPTGFELSSWIRITDSPITLAPNESKTIPFSIEVPKNASPGSHLGGIFFGTVPARPKETGIAVGYQVVTIINLQTAGDINEAAQLIEFRTDKNIYSRPNVSFSARVSNLGNTVLKPRGPIEIKDMFGKNVATLTVNDSAGGVLPKQERAFQTIWESDELAFGRYQAVMGLVFGDTARQTLSATTVFWVLPLNIILPTIAILLLVIFSIMFGVKWHIKKRLQEMNQFSKFNARAIGLNNAPTTHLSRASAIMMAILAAIVISIIVLFFAFA